MKLQYLKIYEPLKYYMCAKDWRESLGSYAKVMGWENRIGWTRSNSI